MYSSKSDLETRIGADTLVILTDDNNDGVADDAVVNAALLQASARIDAAFAARYTVPIEPAPAILSWLCVSIAVPMLYSHRREEIPKGHASLFEAAVDFLDAVRRGEIGIGISPKSLPESTTRDREKHFSGERIAEF